jgi:tagatose-6-phosphate ketose/aldose isomerase
LLVSFARSGNSPESLAAVQLANRFCKKIYHLFITCSPSGKLVSFGHEQPYYTFLLPPEANDQGLAMTGSFTSMLLAGLLISRISNLSNLEQEVQKLTHYGKRILSVYDHFLEKIADLNFERAVFLGSGPLLGAARESHLKLQELTDGRIICKCDSFLGLRHGPRVVIKPGTLMVYLFSNEKHVSLYETDLVKSIQQGEHKPFAIGIFEHNYSPTLALDLEVVLSEDSQSIDESMLAVAQVLPAQLLGFYKSLQLGLSPDNPSLDGTITRVVEGVNIYSFPGSESLKGEGAVS